jgi:hypothetical protein
MQLPSISLYSCNWHIVKRSSGGKSCYSLNELSIGLVVAFALQLAQSFTKLQTAEVRSHLVSIFFLEHYGNTFA